MVWLIPNEKGRFEELEPPVHGDATFCQITLALVVVVLVNVTDYDFKSHSLWIKGNTDFTMTVNYFMLTTDRLKSDRDIS